MRLKAPPHKHKPHSKKVKVNEPLILRSSRVVCSAKNILFSSVYAIKSIIMRTFATWASVYVFKVLNTCGCDRFPSIQRIGMVQTFCSINLNNFTML